MSEVARVISVAERYFGSELSAAASATDGSIFVNDLTEFDESGQLQIGSEVFDYTAVDEDTGEITLDGTLASSYDEEEGVYIYPLTVERIAYLSISDEDEDIQARIPHSLYDKLPVGIRDTGETESVSVDYDGDELVVLDVLGKAPVVDAAYIDVTNLDTSGIEVDLTDGDPPASSPSLAAGVTGGPNYFALKWTAVSNADAVTYEIHESTSSGFTPDGTTLVGETSGTLVFLRKTAAGGDYSYGTTYYFKLIAKDADGAASAGTQGSAQMVKIEYDELNTDGGTPGTPSVSLVSGPGWIQAKWAAVSGTNDPVSYKVFARAGSAPTTSDDTYLVGTVQALSLVITGLTAGTQLDTSVTYHVKVVAVSVISGNVSSASTDATASPAAIDASITTISNLAAGNITSGSLDAARIAAGSLDASKITSDTITATQIAADAITTTELAANAVIAENILAEAVTADKLEAVMVLVNRLIAGTDGAARVEINSTGITAYQSDGTTQTFNVDAITGDLNLRGNASFGADPDSPSQLTSQDYIEYNSVGAVTPTTVYSTPTHVQTAYNYFDNVSTGSLKYGATTQKGNLLLLEVEVYKSSGSVPTVPTPPTGWTLVDTDTQGKVRLYVYKRENSASIAASTDVTVTLSGSTTRFRMRMSEFSGIETASTAQDKTTKNKGTSSSMSTGTTAATTLADELVYAAFTFTTSAAVTFTTPSGYTYVSNSYSPNLSGGMTVRKNVSATGAQSASSTLDSSQDWVGLIVTFKAKASTSGSGPIDAPDFAKVRMYVETRNNNQAGTAADDLGDAAGGNGTNTLPYIMDDWDDLASENPLVVPAGAILPFAGRFAPPGYLLCDGTSYNTFDYQRLFHALAPRLGEAATPVASPGIVTLTAHGLKAGDAVVFTTAPGSQLPTGITQGTTYYVSATSLTADTFKISATRGGAVINFTVTNTGTHYLYFAPYGYNPGASTFAVPDLRQRVPVGLDLSTFQSLGVTGGAETHQLTTAQLPSHTHGAGTLTNAAHTLNFRYSQNMAATGSSDVIRSIEGQPAAQGTATSASFTHNITGSTASAGSDTAHNNLQPYLTVQYIIKY